MLAAQIARIIDPQPNVISLRLPDADDKNSPGNEALQA
jgi:hypothetical protein